MISQDDLIEYASNRLKKQGFRKKNKRWTKTQEDFTLIFFIQGSQWDKDTFYIRPGVLINGFPKSDFDYYGHFWTEIAQDSVEQVFSDLSSFFCNWTDKSRIKKAVVDFLKWEEHNPVEKRRNGNVDYEADPVPDQLLFAVRPPVLQYVIENF